MTSLEERFEAKVDRTGEHHLWTGSKRADGTGQMKVNGRPLPAKRVAWELVHGPLPAGAEVLACAREKACVRVDHLSVRGVAAEVPQFGRRAAHGEGSHMEIRPGVWKLAVTRGRWSNGKPRRFYRTVHADHEIEAIRQKAAFVAEIDAGPLPDNHHEHDMTLDQAVERYLEEYLREEKGREQRTIDGYRQVHEQWFAPEIGQRRIRDIDEESLDRLFGEMRRAGLSSSRMNQAKSLYQPMFRWAKRRRFITRSPMADFELPKSSYVSQVRRTPEADEVSAYLNAAIEVVPDVAPVLVLYATSGLRRGEAGVRRRTDINRRRNELRVDTAQDADGSIKPTKTDKTRDVALDAEVIEMLDRHIEQMDERAAACGVALTSEAFLFSLEPDCSKPMPADHLTKRVAVLKEHLGIGDKRPATIALEDEAVALFRRERQPREPGRRGPNPKGAMSYDDIGRQLNRSGRWAAKAIASAQRREAQALGEVDLFDGSILGLRKFASSELLDAGFNIAVVAQRQGHGPQVLAKHYAQRRPSADRKAAEHLGRLVHRPPSPKDTSSPSL